MSRRDVGHTTEFFTFEFRLVRLEPNNLATLEIEDEVLAQLSPVRRELFDEMLVDYNASIVIYEQPPYGVGDKVRHKRVPELIYTVIDIREDGQIRLRLGEGEFGYFDFKVYEEVGGGVTT